MPISPYFLNGHFLGIFMKTASPVVSIPAINASKAITVGIPDFDPFFTINFSYEINVDINCLLNELFIGKETACVELGLILFKKN